MATMSLHLANTPVCFRCMHCEVHKPVLFCGTPPPHHLGWDPSPKQGEISRRGSDRNPEAI